MSKLSKAISIDLLYLLHYFVQLCPRMHQSDIVYLFTKPRHELRTRYDATSAGIFGTDSYLTTSKLLALALTNGTALADFMTSAAHHVD